MNWEETIQRNLSWFRNSGVLADEGRTGIHEKVWLLEREHPIVNGNKLLEEGIFKYRRVDCALETAIMFALADGIFSGDVNGSIARNLLRFVNETPFQERRLSHPDFGLYAHGLTFDHALPVKMFVDQNPNVRSYIDGTSFWDKKWVDDNSWAVILPLYLWAIDRDLGTNEGVCKALITAQALLDKKEILNGYSRGKLDGVPHWGGMRSMALAYAYFYTKDQRFRDEAISSLQTDLENIEDFRKGKTKQPYDLSNCGYFVMQGSAILRSTGDRDVGGALETVANYLVSRQGESGHFPGEWWEGSRGEHLADLVYGQNWTTLGLQAYARLAGDNKIKAACKKSLEFLAGIQNKSDFARTNGAWLGAYDVKRKKWGGEDRFEGGPSCVYTGWTNAPINTAFIVDHGPLETPVLPPETKKVIFNVYGEALKEYKQHTDTYK